MTAIKTTGRRKRQWAYVQSPSYHEVAPCACGNTDTQWSEWRDHLWCAKCKVDFVPAHWGVFDGPIPIEVSRLMGHDFRQYHLRTKKVRDPLGITWRERRWHKYVRRILPAPKRKGGG